MSKGIQNFKLVVIKMQNKFWFVQHYARQMAQIYFPNYLCEKNMVNSLS